MILEHDAGRERRVSGPQDPNKQMNTIEIVSSIRQFIAGNFPATRHRALRDTDMLLERGLIDSTGVLELVDFLESEFKVSVADEELIPDNFQSIERIALYVERKRHHSTLNTTKESAGNKE
jgi:acyl carrier protein